MRSKRGSSTQTMCYVVAYDIPDDRRRTKVHQILMGFGKWTQYSLFECFLTRKDLILLQSKLGKHLINTEDSVRFYPIRINLRMTAFERSASRFCVPHSGKLMFH